MSNSRLHARCTFDINITSNLYTHREDDCVRANLHYSWIVMAIWEWARERERERKSIHWGHKISKIILATDWTLMLFIRELKYFQSLKCLRIDLVNPEILERFNVHVHFTKSKKHFHRKCKLLCMLCLTHEMCWARSIYLKSSNAFWTASAKG